MTRISYSYTPAGWTQEEFLRQGGFTVVFLNYNKARYIEKSVASALSQDYPILEMFFMDDASTDGSGDEMERMVRQYRGRHKVSVVRNSANQGITGQWNIVSKLATGVWFGMFCGDDVAHRDRVSIVAERIKKYPTLRGISTAAVDIDIDTWKALPDSNYVPIPYLANGRDSWESLDANFNSNGSTSFWHKSLLDEPLPKVPLDDNFLHFKLLVMNRGVDGPIFFYDSSVKTIDYSIGAGICGGGIVVDKSASDRYRWVQEIVRYKCFLTKYVSTMRVSLGYARNKHVPQSCIAPFLCSHWWCKIRAGTTLMRIFMLPALVMTMIFVKVSLGRKASLLKAYLYYLTFEFFGVHFASFIRQFRF